MDQTIPFVTVIMAVHNEELYLEECLDSIIGQTYSDWELIAVNDHSSDRTPSILKEYTLRDSRIRVFNSERHKLIPALQEAYRHSRGTLINRMDADDKMPDYKLKVLVDEWKKYGKGTIIAGGTSHFVEKGELGPGFIRYDRWLNNVAKQSTHFEQIYQECTIPSHCWIIHREDFDSVGAFDPEVYPEDYDLCFRFYKNGLNVEGINRILHFWRDHPERISRTWDCYRDNRYFNLKIQYFFEIDRNACRPLVLWGAGRNGKDLARLLKEKIDKFHWVCDNFKKIGREVYGIELEHYLSIKNLNNPQILIAVNSEKDRRNIREILKVLHRRPVEDYWFFT
jgi:glycosyltransferase involved in cell wall biosynthesis